MDQVSHTLAGSPVVYPRVYRTRDSAHKPHAYPAKTGFFIEVTKVLNRPQADERSHIGTQQNTHVTTTIGMCSIVFWWAPKNHREYEWDHILGE